MRSDQARGGRRAGPSACALLVLALATLAGLGANAASGATHDGCTVVARPKLGPHNVAEPKTLLAAGKRYTITMQTNCGSFSFLVDQAESPHAAASFVALTKIGFFDHTIFHRIVPGFVIQGGDPTGTGLGGPGYTTVDTPPASAAYTHGVVAMAKSSNQPNGAAGSQFFIVTVANANLPAQYAIIGKVTSGLSVVDRIGTLGNAAQQPTMVVEIEKATVSVAG